MDEQWMIQQADEELPFDYLKANCFVPWTHPHDLKRAAQLFSGLSKHVTLCSNDDGTLMLFVAEDEFSVILRTKVLIHWRYEKAKVCYRIPFVALESFADAFQDAQSIRIGVVDDYLVFSGKELDAVQEQDVVAWCKYKESSRLSSYGHINRLASGYVDGLELLKKLIGKDERVTVSSDNFSLQINDRFFSSFELAPGVQQTERFSITLRRFTLGRVLLRVLRFIAPERKIYFAIAGDVFAIVAPDVKGFIHSIGG
jgi:hypothetical protein